MTNINIDGLRDLLFACKVPKSEYSLPGEADTLYEGAVLKQLPDGTYQVFYEERGERYDVKTFVNKSQACQYFLKEFFFEEVMYENIVLLNKNKGLMNENKELLDKNKGQMDILKILMDIVEGIAKEHEKPMPEPLVEKINLFSYYLNTFHEK